jgi:hypothetical protein
MDYRPPTITRIERGTGIGIRSYLRSDLPIAGFALIDAADADEAVKLVSGTPCAVAYGVVEVWPLLATPEENRRG